MKAIILAAGFGKRMGKYTENLPKGMLSFNGKTLIEWQIEKLRSIGLRNIIIVTGYKREVIRYPDITYYHNENYAETNMVQTLLCAREDLNTDILVCYSDIIYTKELAKMAMVSKADIGVCVDEAWKDYWQLRYGTTETDLESLFLSKDGKIIEIGKPVDSSTDINYRYIGLNKFSKKGISDAIKLYDRKKLKNEKWKQSGNPFQKGYMTDLFHELIEEGIEIEPIITRGGWLEFDTTTDYEIMCKLLKNKKLNSEYFL